MKSRIAMIIVLMGLVLGGFSSAFGLSGDMTPFNTANGGTSYSCNVCHTSTSNTAPRNPFGTNWRNLQGRSNYSVTPGTPLGNLDSDGDGIINSAEIQANTNPGVANSPPPPPNDTTPPSVTAFSLPATATSLTVSITTFTATDAVGVTSYCLAESTTPPTTSTPTCWTATKPGSYTFAIVGTKTLYAWARDLAGNVSNSLSGTVTIAAGSSGVDVESPEVMEFTLPLTSNSPTVPILAFRAIDNVEATEHLITYLITTTPAAPAANATGWRATPPASYTFPSGGAKTLYGWARDTAGNVSESLWDNVDIIAASDQTPPVVTSFGIPSTSRTFTVSIRQFTATDNTAVAGYLVTTSSTKPGSSDPKWSSKPPTGFTFTSTGRKRLYPWAKDAAGNVSSASRYGTVMVLGNNQEEDD